MFRRLFVRTKHLQLCSNLPKDVCNLIVKHEMYYDTPKKMLHHYAFVLGDRECESFIPEVLAAGGTYNDQTKLYIERNRRRREMQFRMAELKRLAEADQDLAEELGIKRRRFICTLGTRTRPRAWYSKEQVYHMYSFPL